MSRSVRRERLRSLMYLLQPDRFGVEYSQVTQMFVTQMFR